MGQFSEPRGLSEDPLWDSSARPEVSDSMEELVLDEVQQETRQDVQKVFDAEPIVRELVTPGMPLYDREGYAVLHVMDVNPEEYVFFHYFTPEEKREREKLGKSGEHKILRLERTENIDKTFDKAMRMFGAVYFRPLKIAEDLKAFAHLNQENGIETFRNLLKRKKIRFDMLKMQSENVPEELISAIQALDYGSQRLNLSHQKKLQVHTLSASQLRVLLNLVKAHRSRVFQKLGEKDRRLKKSLESLYQRLIHYLKESKASREWVDSLKKDQVIQLTGVHQLQVNDRDIQEVLNPIMVIKQPGQGKKKEAPETSGYALVDLYNANGDLVASNYRIYHLELLHHVEKKELRRLKNWKPSGQKLVGKKVSSATDEMPIEAIFNQEIEVGEHSEEERRDFIKRLRNSTKMAQQEMELISDMATWIDRHPAEAMREYLQVHRKVIFNALKREGKSDRYLKEIDRLMADNTAWNSANPRVLKALLQHLEAFEQRQVQSVKRQLKHPLKSEKYLELEAKLAVLPMAAAKLKDFLKEQARHNRREKNTLLSSLEPGGILRSPNKLFELQRIDRNNKGKITELVFVVSDLKGSQKKRLTLTPQKLFQKIAEGKLEMTVVGKLQRGGRAIIGERKKQRKTG